MFKETIGDLFSNTQDRTPVHCIASDHRMGAGIAVPMAEKYGLRQPMDKIGRLPWPSCLYINGVMNMVTKDKSSDKPTYEDFTKALSELHRTCRENNITRLVMPRIGCGLDGLDWNVVIRLIVAELQDIDVLVCTAANPALGIKRLRKLETLRGNCRNALRILELGIGPVVILGKEYDKDGTQIAKMLPILDRWISGKDFDESELGKIDAVIARMDGKGASK